MRERGELEDIRERGDRSEHPDSGGPEESQDFLDPTDRREKLGRKVLRATRDRLVWSGCPVSEALRVRRVTREEEAIPDCLVPRVPPARLASEDRRE